MYLVSDDDKQRLLVKLLEQESFERVMVFGNRRDLVRKLDELLKKAGVSAAMLSGDVPQNQRIKTLESFREGEIQVLVATDVAGRGIHIEDVSHVINYTLPEDPEDYVHRIGRTGRAGAKGCRSASWVKKTPSRCRKSSATSTASCPASTRRKACCNAHAG